MYGISQGDPKHAADIIFSQLKEGETIAALCSESARYARDA
ncbi:hypothetical protein [Nonomuraea fuscirosea]